LEPTVVAREDEDDHDLLTYGEVAARLSEEIAAETQRLREWQQQLATGSPVAEECDRSARRLAQLRDAQSRNRRQPITDENFEHFFGFKGQPRRNT
jgi:hypothetical protein